MKREWGPATRAVHGGATPEATTGAVMVPIFQTSTYAQSAPGEFKAYDYSRSGNPTRAALEEALATLEGAKHGLAFSSGLAAEQALLQLIDKPGQVLVCDDVYGGTGRLFRNLFARYGFTFTFVDMRDLEATRAAVRDDLRMVWVETPTNPTLRIIDIAAMSALAGEAEALLVVDNTFSSPVFQSPLALGADIVLHSTTKYIGGHSDLIGGAVMLDDDELASQLGTIQMATGPVPSPMECFLVHRSIKTLPLRMERHQSNALAVAAFLADHLKAKNLRYPGLEGHPQRDLAARQMRGFSGMITFDHAGSYDDTCRFLERLEVFQLAESLGGVESLVNHPARMTHASVPEDLRARLGIGDAMLRLSVGIEDPADLIRDLEQALG